MLFVSDMQVLHAHHIYVYIVHRKNALKLNCLDLFIYITLQFVCRFGILGMTSLGEFTFTVHECSLFVRDTE